MKNCIYCGGEIPQNAAKCKHCGEWLNGKSNKAMGRGSDSARAMSKGMKQKGLQRFAFKWLMILNTVAFFIIGKSVSWGWGFVVFIGVFVLLLCWYYKE